MEHKPVLAGLTLSALESQLSDYPSFRARQIYQWICSGSESFDTMSNLPVSLRKELDEKYRLFAGTVSSKLTDTDGTVKLGITLGDEAVVEAVILGDGEGRKTACISTQAGCQAGCRFCKTGSLGFMRNLTAAEIAGQFLLLRQAASAHEDDAREITHIVVMGMGEPLLNLGELRKALDFIMEESGINISKRRITVSTCGIEKGIRSLADEGPDIRLALSLTTARQELREQLMPLAVTNPLPLLRQALVDYQYKRERRITLEVPLLGGVNTSVIDAEAVADFIHHGGNNGKKLHAVVNLIPWNPVEGLDVDGVPLRSPTTQEITAYASALAAHNIKTTMRFKKGASISGACGQLGVVRAQ